jgi:hypothetical protein
MKSVESQADVEQRIAKSVEGSGRYVTEGHADIFLTEIRKSTQ